MMTLNADLYLNLIRGGAARLAENRQTINDLNVFPIPDGDTGDNMYMTIEAGTHAAGESLSEMASAVSQGMLLGARGNSGVILSRMFAGLSKGFRNLEEADADHFVKAMRAAVEEAYQAVSRPVEGTILTVLREGVEAAASSSSLEDFFDRLTAGMESSLQRTPDLLDVLKKAGVVDSGGAGLLSITEGMRDALYGKSPVLAGSDQPSNAIVDFTSFTEDSVLEFGYCTEFLLRLQRCKVDLENFDETVIRDWLLEQGDSLVFFRDGSIVKVHVHTKDPGAILSRCREWGEFLSIKVENMTLQHHEKRMDERYKCARKALGIVSVAAGKGLSGIFSEMGTDVVIEGGQTMNPPVEKFLEAFDTVNADVVLVFPNNSNILLSARQAADLYKGSRIEVIPTKTLGEGYFALANLQADEAVDDMVHTLTEAASSVTTGLVSRAIRDSEAGAAGNYLGISGKDILCCAPNPREAALALFDKLHASSADIILIFAGADAPEEEAEALKSQIESSCPLSEIILLDGGQPVYNYILVLC